MKERDLYLARTLVSLKPGEMNRHHTLCVISAHVGRPHVGPPEIGASLQRLVDEIMDYYASALADGARWLRRCGAGCVRPAAGFGLRPASPPFA